MAPFIEKIFLASAILGLALLQLVFIAVARGWLGDASARTRRSAVLIHRLGGYTGAAGILLIAYFCIFVVVPLGNPYRYIHMILGAAAVLLVTAKIVVRRALTGWRGRLPSMGAGLLVAITGAWLTSVLWYLVNY
jgi:cation transport ATPase